MTRPEYVLAIGTNTSRGMPYRLYIGSVRLRAYLVLLAYDLTGGAQFRHGRGPVALAAGLGGRAKSEGAFSGIEDAT